MSNVKETQIELDSKKMKAEDKEGNSKSKIT